jgi:hypothetical protein
VIYSAADAVRVIGSTQLSIAVVPSNVHVPYL